MYKYQLHTHTSPCSKCAAMSPVELVSALAEGGYNGCVLTNHFFGGNTGIDRNLSWNDFVKQYYNDYLECKKIAKEYNIDIIFGIEEHLIDGLEILCYGITPQFLLSHPELKENHTPEFWFKTLDNFGALCIQAHPFRDRAYIRNPRILPLKCIHGIETYNYCNSDQENEKAYAISQQHHNLISTAGADAHNINLVCCSGIQTNVRIADENTLVKVLKSKDYQLIL